MSLDVMVSKCLETEYALDGKWFAIKDGEVVAAASTNKELWKKIRKLGVRDALLGYAPSKKEKEAEFLYITLFSA